MTKEHRRAHVAAELARGEQALRASQELLRLGLLHDALSRAHYAASHFARAMLLTEGVEPKTHAGVSRMLGMHFVMPGLIAPERAKDLSRLEQFRAEADYNRFFVLTRDGAARRSMWRSASAPSSAHGSRRRAGAERRVSRADRIWRVGFSLAS